MTAPAFDGWVVVARWIDSAPTFHGPFPSAMAADLWADRVLGAAAACASWDVEMLVAPESTAVAA